MGKKSTGENCNNNRLSRKQAARNWAGGTATAAAVVLVVELLSNQPKSTVSTAGEDFGNDMTLFTSWIEPGPALFSNGDGEKICVYGEMPFLGAGGDEEYLAQRIGVETTPTNLDIIAENLSARDGREMSELTLVDPVKVTMVCSISEGGEITIQTDNNIDK